VAFIWQDRASRGGPQQRVRSLDLKPGYLDRGASVYRIPAQVESDPGRRERTCCGPFEAFLSSVNSHRRIWKYGEFTEQEEPGIRPWDELQQWIWGQFDLEFNHSKSPKRTIVCVGLKGVLQNLFGPFLPPDWSKVHLWAVWKPLIHQQISLRSVQREKSCRVESNQACLKRKSHYPEKASVPPQVWSSTAGRLSVCLLWAVRCSEGQTLV